MFGILLLGGALYAHWSECPACAATNATCTYDGIENNVCIYTTTCNTGYGSIQNNGKYDASCSANSYSCSAGTYLPANSITCATCTAGNFCAGGNYTFSPNEAHGLTSCSTVANGAYPNSVTGATVNTECFTACTVENSGVAHGITFTGNMYYGGTDTCSVTSCDTGYHVKSPLPDATENTSDYGYRSNTGTTDQSLVMGGWKATWSGFGALSGIGVCTTTTGTKSPRTIVPDYTFTGNETGKDCWCKASSWTPSGGSAQSLYAGWLFVSEYDVASDCRSYCAPYCARSIGNNYYDLRTDLFDLVAGQISSCKLSSYECEAGTYLPAGATACTACAADSTCSGGTFYYNTSEDQGITGCPACAATNASCAYNSVVNNVCTYTTACNTGYGNMQNSGAYNASCSVNSYECATGTYLPAGATSCQSCLSGNYACSGGTYDYNANADSGIMECLPCNTTNASCTYNGVVNNACTYTTTCNSGYGAIQNDGKYNASCTLGYNVTYSCGDGSGSPPAADIAYGSATFTPSGYGYCAKSGYVFDGWLVSGTDTVVKDAFIWNYDTDKTLTAQWIVNTCENGYHKEQLTYSTYIGTERGQDRAWKNNNNVAMGNSSTYSVSSDMSWAVNFGDKGTFYGTSLCSTQPGVGLYNGASTAQDVTAYQTLANETRTWHNSNTGTYCYCKITSYVPDGGSKEYISSYNVFARGPSTDSQGLPYPMGCGDTCSGYCSNMFLSPTIFRSAVLNSIDATKTVETCVLSTYECESGTYLPAGEMVCVACTENDYCYGGSYHYDTENDQGICRACNATNASCTYNGMVNNVCTYTTTCNAGYGNIQNDGKYNASCTNSFVCPAGTYLPAGAVECTPCTTGNFCGGDTYNYNANIDQGLTSCSTATNNEYPNSDTSATSIDECYRACTLNDANVEHGTSYDGGVYYDGTNKCVVATCDTGYHTVTASTIADTITAAVGTGNGTGYAYSGHQSSSVTEGGSYSVLEAYVSTTDRFAVNYSTGGALIGRAVCSTTSGRTSVPVSTYDSVQIDFDTGRYCYCQVDGYIPYGGTKQDVTASFVVAKCSASSSDDCSVCQSSNSSCAYTSGGNVSAAAYCSSRCASDCATYLNSTSTYGKADFRNAVLSSIEQEVPTSCEPNSYECAAGTYLPAGGLACAPCLTGNYACAGGTYTYNANAAQGIIECPACAATNATCTYDGVVNNACSYTTVCNAGYGNIQNNGEYNASCESGYIVTYSCGDGTTGNPPTPETGVVGVSFTPANKGTCTNGDKVFDGWLVSGTETVVKNAFTWNYNENKTFTAQWRDPGFSITTTEMTAGTTFKFQMSAAGTFVVDWGDGTVESINRTGNTTLTQYNHTYSGTGPYTIRFSGAATAYNTGNTSPAIRFGTTGTNTPELVAGISGSLGNVFSTLGSANGQQPRFNETFKNCVNITEIPADLFDGVTGNTDGMFRSTFDRCYGITQIPGDLFEGVTGNAQNMFRSTFYECKGITDIPADLFSTVSGAASSMFQYTFYNTTGLTGKYIPATLFDGLNGETPSNLFSSCFDKSTLLESCPTGTDDVTPSVYRSQWNNKVACAPKNYTCAAGTYLPANSITCATCTAGNFCPGGEYAFSETVASGLTACSTLSEGAYPNSDTGATVNTACYNTNCTTADIIGSATVTGKKYYGGTNTCSATTCDSSYDLVPGEFVSDTTIQTTLGNTSGNAYGYINGSGTYTDGTDSGLTSKGRAYYGISDAHSFAVDYGNNGILYGYARCSKTSGTNNGAEWSNPTLFDSLADETGQTGAQYCYCNVSGYKETSVSDFQSISSPWMFTYDDSNSSDCSSSCAFHCSSTFKSVFSNALLFRSAILSRLGTYSAATCEQVGYECAVGTYLPAGETTCVACLQGNYVCSGGIYPQDNERDQGIEECQSCNATNATCSVSVVNNTCTYTTACNNGYGNMQNSGAYNPSCEKEYTVTYSCGVGSGTLPADVVYAGSTFTPVAHPECVYEGRFFTGWLVSDTEDIVHGSFTWNYNENKTLTAQYGDAKFTMTTTEMAADAPFSLAISATGKFLIDWGDGSDVEVIERNDTTSTPYTHYYSEAGAHTIRIGGVATGYSTENNVAAFKVNTTGLLAGMSGSLGSVFPTLNDGSNNLAYQPQFFQSFMGASHLTSVPATLFSGITGAASYMFNYTFSGCSGLLSLPSGLFGGISGAASHMFSNTFYGCSALATIPTELFGGVSGGANSMFINTFSGSGLTEIPSGLFGNISVTNADSMFQLMFSSCSSLKTVPYNLFGNLTGTPASSMFVSTFNNDSALDEFVLSDGETTVSYIPPEFFGSISGNASSMSAIFSGATSIATTCPSGMIQNMTGYESYWNGRVSCRVSETYTITYMDGENTINGLTPTSYAELTSETLPTVVIKTGYTFDGWYDNAGLTGEPVTTIASNETGNKTYYAKFTACPACNATNATCTFDGVVNNVCSYTTACETGYGNIQNSGAYNVSCETEYTVTYSCGDGTGTPPSSAITYSGATFTPAGVGDCSKEGKDFAGWLISGTETTVNNEAFTWNYNENKTFTAQWTDAGFTVTTTSLAANTQFKFKMSAAGVFYVDWGDGSSIQIIDRTDDLEAATYTHTYAKAGSYNIKITGRATGYNPSETIGVINFGKGLSPNYVASVSGIMGSVFPTLESTSVTDADIYPRFFETFQECGALTTISANLFNGVTGATDGMFRSTFDKCTALTGIPSGLFSGVSGHAPNMFRSTFYNCGKLTTIPADLFSGVDDLDDSEFKYTFFGFGKDADAQHPLVPPYIPATLFRSVEGKAYKTDAMMQIFRNSGLVTSCPEHTTQYITGFETYWDSKKACIPDVVCEGAEYASSGVCVPCPTGYTANTTDGKTSATECQISCPAGKYLAEPNDSACSDVGIGFYTTETTLVNYGQTSERQQCGENHTTKTATSTSPAACECLASAYDNNGTCEACPFGYDDNNEMGKTSISQCQIYCPGGQWTDSYTQLSYIEGDGVNMLIDTGYVLTDSKILDMTVVISTPTSTTGTAGNFFGNQNPDGSGFATNYKGNVFGLWSKAAGSKLQSDKMTFDSSKIYTINYTVASNNYQTMTINDGTNEYSKPRTAAFTPTSGAKTTLKLFSNGASEVVDGEVNLLDGDILFAGRIHSFRMTDNNVLVLDLVPARRNSDNAIGMYNRVNGKFYTNAANGTFTAGTDGSAFAGAICTNVGDGYYAGASYTNYGSNGTRIQCPNSALTGMENAQYKRQCAGQSTITCDAGTYLPANANDMECVECLAGSFCGGGTFSYSETLVQGMTACSTLSEGAYPNSAAGSSANTACYVACTTADVANATSVTGNKYYDGTNTCVPADSESCETGYSYVETSGNVLAHCVMDAPSQITCESGEYLPANASACELCPGDSYCIGGTFDFDSENDHGAHACPAGYTYNTDTGKSAESQCQIHCEGGTYLNNSVCVNVGIGYWAAAATFNYGETGIRNACPEGTTNIGYGVGADEAGDCGHKLHIGDWVMYLRSNKKTTHSLNVQYGEDVFYGNVAPGNVYMSDGVNHRLKIILNDVEHSIYDDSGAVYEPPVDEDDDNEKE